jgi:hypothetical protein
MNETAAHRRFLRARNSVRHVVHLRTHELFRVIILHVATYGLIISLEVRYWPFPNSGHTLAPLIVSASCPLYPRKRTCAVQLGMSAG